MVFLEFEQPLESLYDQLEQIKLIEAQGDVDVSAAIRDLDRRAFKAPRLQAARGLPRSLRSKACPFDLTSRGCELLPWARCSWPTPALALRPEDS